MTPAIPSTVIWSYSVAGAVLLAGLATLWRRGEWTAARGLDRLILIGPLCYAMPLAAFGTQHFTIGTTIATFIPGWIPWHLFWTYAIGAGFIAAAFSLVTGIQPGLSAAMLGLNFLLFVAIMDAPAWAAQPGSRFAAALVFRELAFAAGPLGLAAALNTRWPPAVRRIVGTSARFFMVATVLLYSAEQFLHGANVPGVPLKRLMPSYIIGGAIWTYVAAAAYAITGIMLVSEKYARGAAAWLGATVLLIVLGVYLPIAVVDRASLGNGLNYIFDTLMFGGTALLLAAGMPKAPGRP